jgi:hypothetical protein
MRIGGLTFEVADQQPGKRLRICTAGPGERGGIAVEARLSSPKDLQDVADYLISEAETWSAGVLGTPRPTGPDPYKLLGVDRAAPWEVIAAVYRTRAKREHPDKGGDAGAWKAVQAAYDELKRQRGIR